MGWRMLAVISIGLGLVAAAFGILRVDDLELTEVVEEVYTALEWGEVGLWIVIALASLTVCVTHPKRRGVLLGMWLGVLACLATLREMDLHVLLNPGNIHYLGLEPDQAVRFRLDWWTDSQTSIALRAAWAAVLGSVGLAAALPFALAGYPWPRRLLNFDRFAWFVSAGLGLLVLAYVGDDLLANGRVPELAEELIEVSGQVLLLIAVVLLALRRAPMHGAHKAA